MDLQRIITAEEAYLVGSAQQQARPLDALLDDLKPAADLQGELSTRTAAYEFRGFKISAHMLAVLRGYISHGIRPGGFLASVICNDLEGAVGFADPENLANLPAFVAYLVNTAPPACHGSREKFDLWLHRFERAERERTAEAQQPWPGAAETDSEGICA